MNFLLVNDNPAVSRLIVLSVEKLGFKIDEAQSFEELSSNNYDIVFVDSEHYSKDDIDEQKILGLSKKFVYIAKRGEEKPENMEYVLEKPFLPTDFIDLVSKIDSDDNDSKKIEDPETASFENLDDLEPKNTQKEINEDEIDDSLSDLDDLRQLDEVKELDEKIEDTEIILDDDIGLDEDILKDSEIENLEQEVIEQDDIASSVLDSEDIDEVKHLLEDEENTEENDDELSLDEDMNFGEIEDIASVEEEKTTLSDSISENSLEEVSDKEEDSPSNLENIEDDVSEKIEDFELEDLPLETDFNEEFLEIENIKEIDEEKSEKDDLNLDNLEADETKEEDLSLGDSTNENLQELKEEDILIDNLEEEKKDEEELSLDGNIKEESILENDKLSSINDISEKDFLMAFGEEVKEDENKNEEFTIEPNSDEIKKEIQDKISQSVKETLQSSSIKDALKGMRVNISITFDENE